MRNDRSFIELRARERARLLLDDGSYRELLDPFEGIMSPWLGAQGIVPQADDGMVVAKGTINGKPAVVVAIEGAFQGGSMGEVSGAKMAAALELAAEDNRNGIPTQAVLSLETGGVRLQEANLGLAAIADIHAAIVDLRRYTPVVGIVAGTADGGAADQGEGFHMGTQSVVDAAVHMVGIAFAGGFDYGVVFIVDYIGIVAGAAD